MATCVYIYLELIVIDDRKLCAMVGLHKVLRRSILTQRMTSLLVVVLMMLGTSWRMPLVEERVTVMKTMMRVLKRVKVM